MWRPTQHTALHDLAPPWTRAGVKPLRARLERYRARLPEPLRTRVDDALHAEAALPDADASCSAAQLRARYECGRTLERLIYEAEGCDPPEVSWQRPGWLLALRVLDTVRIRFALDQGLIDRAFSRQDAVGTRTERRCEWFWERCGAHAGGPSDGAAPGPSRAGDDYGLYELVREDPDL